MDEVSDVSTLSVDCARIWSPMTKRFMFLECSLSGLGSSSSSRKSGTVFFFFSRSFKP